MKVLRKFAVSMLSLVLLVGSYLGPVNNKTVFAQSLTNAEINNIGESKLNKVDYSNDVIYQVVTDRFYDGDKANNPTGELYDSTKSNYKKYFGGDWQGIIDKINDGYLTGMGITAIWVSQPVENIYSVLSQAGTSYHGYWARDFKKTNPAFGNFDDFKRLIDTAHKNGMKVIIDFAPNHTSPAGEITPDYAENGRLYDNGTLLGGIINDSKNLFNHYGGTDFSTLEDGIYRNLYDLADLNHINPTVDLYLKDAIKLWIGMGIDGIRMDAVKHMPYEWQKSYMDAIYSYNPVFTFGEWFLGAGEVDSNNTNFANNSGMSLLDFRYAQTVRQVLRDNKSNMYKLDEMFTSTAKDYEHINNQVIFIDNHDMDRFSVANNNTSVDQALVLTLTSRGVPAIYYGTEQYMTGNGDPYNRAMMSGFNTNTNAYQIIKALAPLRKSNSALAYGSTKQRWINDDVYIYERKFGDDVVVIALNKSNNSINVSGLVTSLPSGNYSDVLGKRVKGNDIVVNQGTVSSFNLSGNSAAVWSYNTNTSKPNIGNVAHPMAKAGQEVVITGEGFGDVKGTVYFADKAAEVISWTNNEVKVTVPNVSAGKVKVSLQTAEGIKSNIYENYDIVSGDLVTVRFVVNNANTNLGENVFLVGNVPELGSWNATKAIGSLYNQVVYKYPTWYYDVSVPAGSSIEYKFIKKNGNSVTWENGNNHVYTVPKNSTGTVVVNWQN
ncbi:MULTISPECIES: alpha-amylase family glycosyl hydrolase [Clostridium]|uniref:alpha-amylase family glycosyl hydrolase n=1 Tax=Clostridium TaxID=1485 RepID=UPI001899989F|nr:MULTISPECIES: alpha-amylase family glycosyl hydrolase [Clostridium]MDI9219268.1 alpha-amylase family glycosyl hydrolase [Clostridium tertium]